jgi:hypothetical protein
LRTGWISSFARTPDRMLAAALRYREAKRVTQLGRTIAFVEGKLTAEDGTLLATATASERLLDAARVVL